MTLVEFMWARLAIGERLGYDVADLAAKRRLLDEYEEVAELDRPGALGRARGLGDAVRMLAMVYVDHQDYCPEEWAI